MGNDSRRRHSECCSTDSSPELPPQPCSEDSDPDEADIEEYACYPGRSMADQLQPSNLPGYHGLLQPGSEGESFTGPAGSHSTNVIGPGERDQFPGFSTTFTRTTSLRPPSVTISFAQ